MWAPVVLGLNDALVELTGVLAGLTLALRETRLIAMAGLITGIAASLSMAASEYLSTKTEEVDKDPDPCDPLYRLELCHHGLLPHFPLFRILETLMFAWDSPCGTRFVVILIFTFYISVAKDIRFRKRFFGDVLSSA